MGFLNNLRVPYKHCRVIEITTSGAHTSGDLAKYGDVVGVLYATVGSGEEATLVVHIPAPGVKVAKTTGETWTPGQKLYFVTGTGMLTTTEGVNTFAGYAVEAAASGDTEGIAALQSL